MPAYFHWKNLRYAIIAAIALCVAAPATAQRGMVGSIEGEAPPAADVRIENPFEFPVKVIGVRAVFIAPEDGSEIHYFSEPGWSVDLTGVSGGTASWEGELSFVGRDGQPMPGDAVWAEHDRVTVGAGVDVPALEQRTEEAISSGDSEALRTLLDDVRARLSVVSVTSRFHEPQIEAQPAALQAWFDLERVESLQDRLRDEICERASQYLLSARGSGARYERYTEVVASLREAGLYVTCMTEEARLAAARALINAGRAQDALVFTARDDEGNIPERWLPIYVAGHLSLARTAIELEVDTFQTYVDVLRSLKQLKELAPDNRDVREVEDALIPRAGRFVSTALQRGDTEDAYTVLSLLRPTWAGVEEVETAAAALAEKLLEEGFAHAERGHYVNARNRFLRGERVLEGVPTWEARREEINEARALGSLEDGVEYAQQGDFDLADEQLEIALGMYDLSEEQVAGFHRRVADAYVSRARELISEDAFAGARDALEKAETVSPDGPTEAIRTAWLDYAEGVYEYNGWLIKGEEVDDARAAIARAGEVDAQRASRLLGQLSTAYYGYRVGIPAATLLLIAIALVIARIRSRRAAKFEELADVP